MNKSQRSEWDVIREHDVNATGICLDYAAGRNVCLNDPHARVHHNRHTVTDEKQDLYLRCP